MSGSGTSWVKDLLILVHYASQNTHLNPLTNCLWGANSRTKASSSSAGADSCKAPTCHMLTWPCLSAAAKIAWPEAPLNAICTCVWVIREHEGGPSLLVSLSATKMGAHNATLRDFGSCVDPELLERSCRHTLRIWQSFSSLQHFQQALVQLRVLFQRLEWEWSCTHVLLTALLMGTLSYHNSKSGNLSGWLQRYPVDGVP